MRRKRMLNGFLIMAVTALLVAACTAEEPVAEPEPDPAITEPEPEADADEPGVPDPDTDLFPVRITINPWVGYAPWWIADEQGFAADHGIELEFVTIMSPAEANAAVASGTVDVANLPINLFLIQLSTGLELQAVLFEDISLTGDGIIAGEGISSIEDLRGRTVAVEVGSTPELVLLYALEEHGMTIDDIEALPMPSSDAGAALLAGRVDAAATYQPYLGVAMAEGLDLIYHAGARPGLISDILVVPDAFANDQPDIVVGLLLAWHESVEFLRTNTEEAYDIINRRSGVELDLAAMYEGVTMFDLTESQDFLVSEYVALATDIERILREKGELEGEVDINNSFDPSFGERALSILGS